MPFTLTSRKQPRPAQNPRAQRSALRDLQRNLAEEADAHTDEAFRSELDKSAAAKPQRRRAMPGVDLADPVTEDAPATAAPRAARPADALPGAAEQIRPQGSFRDFKTALRSYLTGIEAGRVTATELAQRVGEDAVTAYQRSDLTLEHLQYRAVDPRGFVGYRFGEELLETLGYYRPSARALDDRRVAARSRSEAGQSNVTNRWDGQFTGLNGAFSLKDFATARVQEIAIGEAFAWHLQQIIGLLPEDSGLGDVVGVQREMGPPPRSRGIGRTTSEVTISGMLAAAQVYGAAAVADYVLGQVSAKDATAQGVHRLMDEFAGYATPYDTIPCPSDNDVGRLIKRVRTRADSMSSLSAPSSDLTWLR
ncbi:MAG: hypothetical protein RIB84_29555 [Sneathiellaceae bacterium]